MSKCYHLHVLLTQMRYGKAMSVLSWLLFIAAILFVIVAFVKYRHEPITDERSEADKERDYRIAVAMGAMGHDIKYAAAVRYALTRFEEEKGRRATEQELATLIGTAVGVARASEQ
jgi:type II secretory pathway component PulJ